MVLEVSILTKKLIHLGHTAIMIVVLELRPAVVQVNAAGMLVCRQGQFMLFEGVIQLVKSLLMISSSMNHVNIRQTLLVCTCTLLLRDGNVSGISSKSYKHLIGEPGTYLECLSPMMKTQELLSLGANGAELLVLEIEWQVMNGIMTPEIGKLQEVQMTTNLVVFTCFLVLQSKGMVREDC
jgi:hypothetical protein